jgi:hypothetical protein
LIARLPARGFAPAGAGRGRSLLLWRNGTATRDHSDLVARRGADKAGATEKTGKSRDSLWAAEKSYKDIFI